MRRKRRASTAWVNACERRCQSRALNPRSDGLSDFLMSPGYYQRAICQNNFVYSLSEAVVETLKHLRRHTRGPLILVWDRAPIHRGKKVMAYLAEHPAIHVEWLPPCAPDINPEEFCHGNVKTRMKNAMPMNREEIRHMANNGFARLRHRPDLIISFIHHAGLSVKQLW